MNTRTKKITLFALVTALCLAISLLGLLHGVTYASAETSSEYPGLEFLLINDGNEYNVRAADKQITQASIPSTYNGLPVTEIADNGFSACTLLEKVIIPPSVKRVGNNAFMRCTNLTEVSGMSNVTTYGVSAFAMCSNLDYFILPYRIESLGSGMLRNVNCTLYSRATEAELSTFNTSWRTSFNGDIIYGNGLVFNSYTLNGETGLTLVPFQNIYTTEKLIIPSFIEFDKDGNTVNEKLIHISSYALCGCEADEIIVKHPDGSNFNHAINLDAYAFSYAVTNNIRIETDITLNGVEYETSEGIFADSTIKSVTLPNCITEYPKYMFSGCEQLAQINNMDQSVKVNHVSDKVVKIGAEAFRNCYALDELYIAETIEEIGSNAFSNWGNKPNPSADYKQRISINIFEEDAVGWTLWDNDINADYCEIDFTAASDFTVSFVADKDGVHNVSGNEVIIVPRGTILNKGSNIPVPTSTSHDFTNIWYTSEERIVGTEFDFGKPIKRNYILYAGWSVKIFDIVFENNGIVNFYTNNSNREKLNGQSLKFEYGWKFDFIVETKLGYENTGIFYEGTSVEADSNGVYTIYVVKNGIIKSRSDKREFNITYKNLRGGTKGANNKDIYTIDDLPLQLDDPVWTQGYRYGVWELPPVTESTLRDIEVTALWSGAVKHTITYNNLQAGTKGANNGDTYTADDLTETNNYTLKLDNPTWPQVYGEGKWNMPLINDQNLIDFTATAVWSKPSFYTITYINLQGGTKGANNKDTYTADDLPLKLDDPTWSVAYKSGKWVYPEITADTLGNITAEAVWDVPIEYNITYDGPKDLEFYYSLDELPWWYDTAPSLKKNMNKDVFTYFDEVYLGYVPGKTGYIGEWLLDGRVVEKIPAGTARDITLIYRWKPITYTVEFCYQNVRGFDGNYYNYDADIAERKSIKATYNVQGVEYAKEIEGFNFYRWYIDYYDRNYPTQSFDKLNNPLRYENLRCYQGADVQIILVYDGVGGGDDGGCVADGTLITLADGSRRAVESLNGDEMLLVWNLNTGTFDTAPILFIDREPAQMTEVIYLCFSDDTKVKVIYEHGFWDCNLNRYVYLDKYAEKYIGHCFNKQIWDENGNMTWTKVQLLNVDVVSEYTSAWSPVTYGHLCYYVNGMLSMPGGISGLFNIFEVGEDMEFDSTAMENDIKSYGLFTYEEFAEIVPVPEEMFNAVSGQYLKVAVGKGLITIEDIEKLVNRYGKFFA